MVKVLTYLKAFGDIPRAQECLAVFTALCIVDNLVSPGVLVKLFQDHLVKDGLSLTFVTTVFTIWVKEKGMPAVGSALRRAKLENRLLVRKKVVAPFININQLPPPELFAPHSSEQGAL